jgi:ketopantoate reductase
LSPYTTIISVCNGSMEGMLGRFAKSYEHFSWRLGFCTFGVTLSEGSYSLCSQSGRMFWGPLNRGELPSKTEVELSRLGSLFEWKDDILPLVRKKWLFNTSLNTVSALRQLSCNGDILKHLELAKALFAEAYQLGGSLWGPWNESQEESFHDFIKLIHDTKDNENSMARDVRLHRKTESGYLAGLAKEADKYPLLVQSHKKIISQ